MENMIERLGQDGMSSEESEEENDIQVIYRPRNMYWRRPMDKELDMIDKEYRRLGQTKNRRGQKVGIRTRVPSAEDSQRGPVVGLPNCLYNERWMSIQTQLYVKDTLKLKKSSFRWMELSGL